MSKAKSNGHLTVAQLRELRAEMTWGDQNYAIKQARPPDGGAPDETDLVAHAMHRAAQRSGLAGKDFEKFLDSVRFEDLQEFVTEDRSPLSSATKD